MDVDRTEGVAGEIGQSGRTSSHEPEEGGGAFGNPSWKSSTEGFQREKGQDTVHSVRRSPDCPAEAVKSEHESHRMVSASIPSRTQVLSLLFNVTRPFTSSVLLLELQPYSEFCALG